MALFVLRLENRTSMLGWITEVTTGAGAAWWSRQEPLKVDQWIDPGGCVLGYIDVEPGAARWEWSLTVTFPGVAKARIEFGTERTNGVLKAIVGGRATDDRLQIHATGFPRTGDLLRGLVSIIDTRSSSGSVWTDTLADITAERPALTLEILNKTTIPATVVGVTKRDVEERPPQATAIPRLREDVLIAPETGQGANMVAETYTVERDRPFQLHVLVCVASVPVPGGGTAGNHVAIRIGASQRAGGWHFFHSAHLLRVGGWPWVTVRERVWVVTDMGIFYTVELLPRPTGKVLAAKPHPLF